MKTKSQRHQPWIYFFSILLTTLHVHHGLCRPPSSSHESVLPDQPRVRPSPDLTDSSQMQLRYGNDTSHLLLLSSGYVVVDHSYDVIEDDDDDDDAPTRDDVTQEGSLPRHQVSDRNLVRRRRQPEQHRPHRRRRRKHRLVLKARRNHLSEGGELKDRRGRYIIKSDSPEYLITSASEIKKDWCRTIPLRQKVSEPDCRSRVVQNNFCYGQCNSFFIPHPGRTDNKVAFQSCAFCKPNRQHWGNVTLNCPGRNPPKVEKTVLFVDSCRCVTEVFQ